jgi:hypothetical protein
MYYFGATLDNGLSHGWLQDEKRDHDLDSLLLLRQGTGFSPWQGVAWLGVQAWHVISVQGQFNSPRLKN